MKTWANVLLLIGALVVGFTAGVSTLGFSAQLNPEGVREQVIKNTQRLEYIEHEVGEFKSWEEQHMRDHMQTNAALASQLREQQVTLEHHEKLFWLVFAALLSVGIKLIVDFAKSKQRFEEDQEPPHHRRAESSDEE